MQRDSIENMEESEQFDIINLGPDMGAIWGKIISTLRDTDSILYSICVSNVDTMFDQETIILTLRDDAMYTILNKNKPKLQEIAHPTNIEITYSNKTQKQTNPKINQLKEIFGDRLIMVK